MSTSDFRKVQDRSSERAPARNSADHLAHALVEGHLLGLLLAIKTGGEVDERRLSEAVRRFTAEARAQQILPERLIVAVKERCEALPTGTFRYNAADCAHRLSGFITQLLDEYYRAPK